MSADEAAAAPVIRDAQASDVPAVVAIEWASFPDPWSAQSFRGLVSQPPARFRVAEVLGEIAGYSVAWQVGDEAELANLAVAAAARRQGVGRALLDDLLRHADERGVATTYLEVREGNAAAQALYRSRGFAEAGRRRHYYREPVEDAVVMRRSVLRGDEAGSAD